MTKGTKRLLAALLCLALCVSLLPLPAMAEAGTISAAEEGTITMAGESGSIAEPGSVSKEDIEKSVKKAFDKILYKLEKSEDYKYSAIICSSCAARYSMLVADKDTEGRAYEGRIPEGINVQGVYIYGEFCPAHGKHNDGLYNALSNCTFTILAI